MPKTGKDINEVDAVLVVAAKQGGFFYVLCFIHTCMDQTDLIYFSGQNNITLICKSCLNIHYILDSVVVRRWTHIRKIVD